MLDHGRAAIDARVVVRTAALILGLLPTFLPASAQGATVAIAKSQFVPVYAIPQESEKPWGFAVSGKEYPVVSRMGGWVSIEFFDDNGWVREQDVTITTAGRPPAPTTQASPSTTEPVPGSTESPASTVQPPISVTSPSIVQSAVKPSKAPTVQGAGFDRVTVLEQYVKVTTRPSSESKVVAFALKGEEFPVLGVSGDFVQILYKQTPGYLPRSVCKPVAGMNANSGSESSGELTSSDVESLLLSATKSIAYPESTGKTRAGTQAQSDIGLPIPEGNEFSGARIDRQTADGTSQTPSSVPDTLRQVFGTPAVIVQVPVPGEERVSTSPKRQYSPAPKNWTSSALRVIQLLPWYYVAGFSVLFFGGIGVLAVMLYRIFFSLPGAWIKGAGRSQQCIVVGEGQLYVLVGVAGKVMTLDKFLEAGGYQAKHFENGTVAGVSVKHSSADVLFVHWSERKEIAGTIEEILTTTERNLRCIYYAVPESAKTAEYRISRGVNFLGASVNARQLMAMIHAPYIPASRSRAGLLKLSTETSSLQGAIGADTLSEVLQYIETTTKTGCLHIELERPYGMIFFENGIIVHSSTNQAQDEQAVREILNLKRGTFRFVTTTRHFTRTTHISIMSILMEWAQFRDESVLDKPNPPQDTPGPAA